MNWVQVRHRMPEKNKDLLLFRNNIKSPVIGMLEGNQFGSLNCAGDFEPFSDITHWMNLPEDPKEF